MEGREERVKYIIIFSTITYIGCFKLFIYMV
jgi:hypothetical protein